MCKNEFNGHILIQIDNTSAASAINEMGSVKSIEMDNEVHLVREFNSTQNKWLTATHITGVSNEHDDRETRKQEVRTEWILNRKHFHYITEKCNVSPSTDLLAYTQLPELLSYRPDPESKALSLNHAQITVQCFFSDYMFAQIYSENMAKWSRGNAGIT